MSNSVGSTFGAEYSGISPYDGLSIGNYHDSCHQEEEGSGSPYPRNACECSNSVFYAEQELGIDCNLSRILYYYQPDYLGHNEYITDITGRPYQYFHYSAFGESLIEKNTNYGQFSSPYRFNGKELDPETGNYYYGARYYNPVWGVWLGVDPLAEKYASWSGYNYVLGNPVRLIDPDGREPMSVDGEYEITHDKNGNEVKTKVSNLGDDVGIDFNHHLDGDRKGQTEIVNTKNGFTNWIADSRFMRGYTQRDESTNWKSVYDEWQSGTGPENSLFFGRDNNMIKDIRTSNLYHGARNNYLKAQAWDFDNKISKKYIPIDFGLSGLLLSGTNMTMQMMGSGGASFYDIGNYQRLVMITDQKTKESFYYHLPWINNVSRSGSGTQPRQSTTNQTYIWIDNNVEK